MRLQPGPRMSLAKTPSTFSSLSVLPKTLLSDSKDETLLSDSKDASVQDLREVEALFRAGDAGDGCYRIRKGHVKVVVTSTLLVQRGGSDHCLPVDQRSRRSNP